MADTSIPRRPLGRSGDLVSAVGLGGYHLGLVKSDREAVRIVHAAVDAGVTFMDNAWELYKTSAIFEGKVGREQHGFPSEEEVSA